MLSEVISEGHSCWFPCLNKRPSQCLKWLSLPFENTVRRQEESPHWQLTAGPWSGSSGKKCFCCLSHTVDGILWQQPKNNAVMLSLQSVASRLSHSDGSTFMSSGGHREARSDSCDLMDCSLPGSSVHGISQARVLEWVAIPFSSGFNSQPRDWTCVSCLGREIILPLNHQARPHNQNRHT